MLWSSVFHLYTSSFNVLSLHLFFRRKDESIHWKSWQITLISSFLLLEIIGNILLPPVAASILNLILSFLTTYSIGRIYVYSKTSSLVWASVFLELGLLVENSLFFLLFQILGLPPTQELSSLFLYTTNLVLLGFGLVFTLRHFVLLRLPDIELSSNIRYRIVIIPFLTSTSIFLDLLARLSPEIHPLYQSSQPIILLLIGATSLLLYQDLLYEVKKSEDSKLQQLRNQHQVAILEEQLERYNRIRALHHDWKNQQLILQGLLQTQRYQEAIEQLGGQMNWQEQEILKHSSDPALNLLLQTKEALANQQDTFLEITCSLGPYQSLDPQITAVLIGNLLDNALKATKYLQSKQDRWIHLTILVEQGRLSIHAVNPYNPKIKLTDGQGLGIPNMKSLVNTYHGLYQARGDDQLFQAHILIPIINENPPVW